MSVGRQVFLKGKSLTRKIKEFCQEIKVQPKNEKDLSKSKNLIKIIFFLSDKDLAKKK
jgi:hypothetical protein